MRNPDRIDIICKELAEQWKRVPDWRLAQLIDNVQRREGNDLFYCEDARFVSLIKTFLDDGLGAQ